MHMMETVYAAGAEPSMLRPIHEASDLEPLMGASQVLHVSTKPLPAEARYDVPIQTSTRSTRIARVSVAIIASALMLVIPLFLLWNSRARAAVPLTIFYGAASMILTAMLAGQQSATVTRAAVVAMIVAPASLTHLALTFPRERPVLREVPELARIPYMVALVLIPIGWIALERDRLLGPAFLGLLLVLGGAAWAILLTSCYLAIRESESATERARARLVFYGAMIVPLVPTAFGWPASEGTVRLGVLYLWSAAATMPLPIALAISRYNLFDLGWDVRHAAARVIYLGTAALIASMVLRLATWIIDAQVLLLDAAPLFLVCFVAVAAIEPLRTRMPGLIESVVAPRLLELRGVREALERDFEAPIDDDGVARCLGEAVRDGLGVDSVAIFLDDGGDWRSAYLQGSGATGLELLNEALGALGDRFIVHLPAEPETERRSTRLRAARIEAVAAIECSGEQFGVALVGRPTRRGPFTGVEIEFLRAIAARAGTALRNARLTEGLIAAERGATTGRLAVGLAHDLGKDLGWIRRLSGRLPRLFGDEERLRRDATMIHELSEGLSAAVSRFVDESSASTRPGEVAEPFGEVADKAVRRVTRAHGGDRVTQTIDPTIRSMDVHEHLGRVIGNLLDNALHASPSDESVHLFATLDEEGFIVTIEDHGCGVPGSLGHRVFDAGVTTRRDQGGSGVGLTVSREIVKNLGGTLHLEQARPRGTRAIVRIPRRKDS